MSKYYVELNGKEIDPDTGKVIPGETLLFKILWGIEANSPGEAKRIGREKANEYSQDMGVKITKIEVHEQKF